MYVCICKAVTDGHIREAVRQGCCTSGDLARCFGAGRDCGKCRGELKSLLQVLKAERPEAVAGGSDPGR
ncbi:MAG: (2Fe-2S)-binding protein [Methylotetracoccus sp.]